MKYFVWTDDLPERENVRPSRAGSAAAAEVYAAARLQYDGQPIYVEDADGDVRRFVVVDGVASWLEP